MPKNIGGQNSIPNPEKLNSKEREGQQVEQVIGEPVKPVEEIKAEFERLETMKREDKKMVEEEIPKLQQEVGGAFSKGDNQRPERKREIYEGMSEEDRARHFWETQLQHEVRIEYPQSPQCEFAILIPVYNEKPERILKQIESFKNQKDIDPSQFELIYVVNNDLPNERPKSQEAIEANQKVIEMLRGISDLNVFVIDKSSPGNEIPECNVGKARNRGVAEASLRFYENAKNGVLIQTDADTYFEDQNYLAELRTIVNKNPDAIGIAGGLIYEFSPDTDSEEEKNELRKKLDRMVLIKKWDRLVEFLRNPKNPSFLENKNFSGANMISRSYESAIVGGLIDANAAEDVQFGLDLETYGAGRGQKTIGAKSDLRVVTALRESDRTGASFKKDFNSIDISRPIMVSDPFAKETLPEFRASAKTVLVESTLNAEKLRTLLTDERGTLIVSEDSLNELIDYVGENGYKENDYFYKQWIKKNFGEGYDLVRQLYDARYPQIPITEENYQRLASKISEELDGSKLITYVNAVAENIRIP